MEIIDELLNQEEAAEESSAAWISDLQDATHWLKMLDHIEQRYQAGEKALADGKWGVAIVALEEVAANDPDFRDVNHLLAQAREADQLAHWHDEASEHQEAGRWDEACRIWAQVLRQRADYESDTAVSSLLNALDGLLGQYTRLTERLTPEPKEGEIGEPEAGVDGGE
jgi:tetratricopeptide (TPR) repeat protein